jgi:uracil-DNA glycosylase
MENPNTNSSGNNDSNGNSNGSSSSSGNKKTPLRLAFFGGAPAAKRKPTALAPTDRKRARVMPTDLDPAVEQLIVHLREPSWRSVLADEFQEPYFVGLANFLEKERSTAREIYPPPEHVFSQLALCPFDRVKVVILGQDPYHGPGQAHGLSFSVQLGVAVPPSLDNIFKELTDDPDVDFSRPDHGNLEKWARQGVLLLNSVLTVEARRAGSHGNRGWERFTDAIVKAISDEREGVVFMLWGRYAQNKGRVIDTKKHHVLTSAHPSPYSAEGFFGKRHFSTANRLLGQRRKIDWRLDPKAVESQTQAKWWEERAAAETARTCA